MKRNDFLIRLISIIVFVALVVYIGYYLIDAKMSGFKTVLATTYTVEEGIPLEGFFLKDETLLYGDSGKTALTAGEGERLAAGDSYAVEYADSSAMERASEIRTTELEIQQVEALIGTAAAKDRTSQSIQDLSYALSMGDYSSLDEAGMGVRTYILGENSEYGDEQLKERLSELKNRLQSLQAQADTDMLYITTDEAGTFSSAVDGYEGLGSDDILSLTPTRIESMLEEERETETRAIGKLITGTKWYFAGVIDNEDALLLEKGGTATLSFSSVFEEPVELTVENIGTEQNGKCVVVFSCGRYFYKVAAARQSSATIIVESLSGIRIPKEGLYQNEEGEDVVYVVAGLQAREKKVEIIRELYDGYLVEGTKESVLRVGDEIIVGAEELYDDKVIM